MSCLEPRPCEFEIGKSVRSLCIAGCVLSRHSLAKLHHRPQAHRAFRRASDCDSEREKHQWAILD